MNQEPRENTDIIFLEADASTLKPGPISAASLKIAQEYLEKLRQYRPEEYAEIMREREARKKQHP